jgi:hypothetical protein
MLVDEKYFNSDKNYLLKTVQAFSKNMLLDIWVTNAYTAYNRHFNPMGLEDDFIVGLKSKISHSKMILDSNYDLLAAIYRFKYSDNQLEFNWDGRSHMEKYDEDWKITYHLWIKELCELTDVLKAIIKFAASYEQTNTDFIQQSIRRGILHHFDLRLRARTLYQLSA